MPRIPSPFTAPVLVALACGALFTSAADAAAMTYRTVDYPGAHATEVFAVNDLRQFVGAEVEADGTNHAVIDDGTGLARLDLDALDASQSWAFSINTHTDVAGSFIDAAGHSHGYVHHADGSIETIDVPGGFETQGYGVNDRGTVIGLYNDAQGATHAYARIRGKFVNLDIAGGVATTPLSVNDSNEIVGELQMSDGTLGKGFVRTADGHVTLHQAPGSLPDSTLFISANNRGEVLGSWQDADGNYVNFLRKQAKYYPVALPDSFGATFTSAQTLNDRNDIVGYYVGPDGLIHGWAAWSQGLAH